MSRAQVDWHAVQTQFEELLASEETSGEEEVASFESVLGSATDELETKFSKARMYAQRLGTTAASSPDGHIFINGKYHVANDVCCRDCLKMLCLTMEELEFFEFITVCRRASPSALPRKRALPFLLWITVIYPIAVSSRSIRV